MWPIPQSPGSHLLKKSLMENFIFCAVYVWCKKGGQERNETKLSSSFDYDIFILLSPKKMVVTSIKKLHLNWGIYIEDVKISV